MKIVKLEDLSIEQLEKKQDKFNFLTGAFCVAGISAMLATSIGLVALTVNALFAIVGYLISAPFFVGSLKCSMIADECSKIIDKKLINKEILNCVKPQEQETQINMEKDNLDKMIEYFNNKTSNFKTVKFEINNSAKYEQNNQLTENEIEKE